MLMRGWVSPGTLVSPTGVPVRFFLKPETPSLEQTHKNKRVQLLMVDHSARASIKNAASCEN